MYQLKSCVWELTKTCNMRCLHCGSQAGEGRENELSEPEAFHIADQLIDLGCERVTLIGGEVTLCPYWSRLARYLSDNGIICDIVTNGYQKTEQDFLDFQDSHIVSAAISIDGTEELHNTIRGRKDAFEESERFCRRMAEIKIPLTAVTTITKRCVKVLGAMYDWMAEHEILAWQWQQVTMMGNARDNRLPSLEAEDIEKVFDFYTTLSHKKKLPIILGDNLGYYVEREGKLLHTFHGCAAGLSAIGLDSKGNVRGCASLCDKRYIEGNLREVSLKEIWESSESFAYNRKFVPNWLTGKCLTCGMGADCAGGCRSFNLYQGSLYEHSNCICKYNITGKMLYPSAHEEPPMVLTAGPLPYLDKPCDAYPCIHEREHILLYAGPPLPR